MSTTITSTAGATNEPREGEAPSEPHAGTGARRLAQRPALPVAPVHWTTNQHACWFQSEHEHEQERKRASVRQLGMAHVLLVVSLALAGCRSDMQDQPRYEPFAHSTFFDDERASRPLVPGTVARGHLDLDAAFYRGESDDGGPVNGSPVPVTRALLVRGQQRYDIYCSPCHDRVGTGVGMIVERGFKRPPSLHAARLRESPAGYFFQVITNGFGVMSSYAAQIPPHDRWAIVAYIRALQLSQGATLDDVPAEERSALERGDG